MKWRWDQGRLNYFQYENLKAIAYCLTELDGVKINERDVDPLRAKLEEYTVLPFSPNSYRVWRNYKRVFECSFLATNINDHLYITDFCKKIAPPTGTEGINVDEFLSLFIPRFRFPFAAFNDYQKTNEIIYPFCTLFKYLFSKFQLSGNALITLEDVFSILIGNNCTGFEPLEHYLNLKRTNYVPTGDEKRQVREMMAFVSQLSILKWYKGALYLDVTIKDYYEYDQFQYLINPIFKEPKQIREEEYLAMTSLNDAPIYKFDLLSRESPTDELFIEGKRSRVTHFKIERSPLLRKIFFEKFPETVCDMCTCNTRTRYPWTDNILEVHHILPLSSALSITTNGTSLQDVVGLCPNCHKSVHSYYRNWLNKYNLNDFRDHSEAKEIYYQAKTSIIL